MQNLARLRRQCLLFLIALALVLPVLTVFSAWLPGLGNEADAFAIVREMFATVLPAYLRTTVALGLMVAVGTALVGTVCAALVTLFDFRGRKTLEWLLLLPLAMPAYVTAYAYTDFLQFSGPLQVGLRAAFGWEGRLLPEIRSLGGAVLVFVVALYPYVYLLARTALSERAAHLMEAARLLGAPMARRIRTVALPMARPAVVAWAIGGSRQQQEELAGREESEQHAGVAVGAGCCASLKTGILPSVWKCSQATPCGSVIQCFSLRA